MKEIKAYIKKHKLDTVVLALHKIKNMPGFSVSEIRGLGTKHTEDGHMCRLDELARHIKIEVVCLDEQAEEIIATIQKVAHTGLPGDGKIYIGTLEEGISIHTGARGPRVV